MKNLETALANAQTAYQKAQAEAEAAQAKAKAEKAARAKSKASLQRTLKAHIDRRLIQGTLEPRLVNAWLKTQEKPKAAYLGLAWELLNSPIHGVMRSPTGEWILGSKTYGTYKDLSYALQNVLGYEPFDYLPAFLGAIANGVESPDKAIYDAFRYQEPLAEPEDLTMEDAIALRSAVGGDPLDPLTNDLGEDPEGLDLNWEETSEETPEEPVDLRDVDPETLTVEQRLERLDRLMGDI